ncbi:MAG: very short patch repair endonuclease [Planctomycetota bacterium]|nr:very short patch repair endonuclease [Planctomycetota bacterium]
MADVFDRETRSRVMARVRGEDTKPELLVRKWLYAKGYRYRVHRRDLPGKPDIVLSRLRTAVFVNGCFWHGHTRCSHSALPVTNQRYWRQKIERTVRRDRRNAQRLRHLGWHVVTVWECRIKEDSYLTKRLLAPLKRLENKVER